MDALLGEQRRPHKDLDVALALADVDAAIRLLGERGICAGPGRRAEVVRS